MNRLRILKSGLISAMIVAMMFAITVPAASAVNPSYSSPSLCGEGVMARVGGTLSGGSYYSCSWHVERWLGSADSFASVMVFTLYANGTPMSSSTTGTSYDTSNSGPLTSLGASAVSLFYDSQYGTMMRQSGIASLP